MHFFVRLTSDQVLRILQHDRMPSYLFGVIGSASTPNRELCCLHSGAKLYLDSEYQYSLCGYDYEHGHDVRCYERVIHPWIPKHSIVKPKQFVPQYYNDYAAREVRHSTHFSLRKINSLHPDVVRPWTAKEWAAYCACFNEPSTCAGIVPTRKNIDYRWHKVS